MSAPWVLAGSLLALPVAFLVWRLALRELGSRPAALVAALVSFVALAVFPERVRTAVDDTRRFRDVPVELRDRYGSRLIADERVFRALRARIAADETYYVHLGPPPTPEEPELDGPFRHWTFWWLLPRVAVDSPQEADWIVSRNADPETLGVELGEIVNVGTTTSLGRVR